MSRTRSGLLVCLSLVTLVFLLLEGGAARAGAPGAAAEQAADEGDPSEDLDQIVAGHVRRAEEAQRRGRYDEAVEALKTAYQMDPQPVFLLRGAQAYHKAGRVKEALVMYRDFLEKDPTSPERRTAEAAVRELERRRAEEERPPVWKRAWFWAIIGGAAVAAVGLGVGLGVGLRGSDAGPMIEF